MFAGIHAAEGTLPDALMEVARDFSPRVERCGPREVTLDVSGLTRLFGDARTIARELRRTAAERHLQVSVAIAGTRTAARLLAHSSSRAVTACATDAADVIVIEPGTEAISVAELPIELLELFAADEPRLHDSTFPHPVSITLRRWGLRSLGELAALPPGEVAARLGQAGVEWQRLARGDDRRPLVPSVPEERFEQALDLEWPIEGLEPLSFVLGRLMEPLSAHLARRDRGCAVLHVRLHLVTREVHERSLQLPAPMRDARTLRTLALLDLESHPPSAAIDRVVVAIDPTPGRVIQFSLLTRPLPSPEQLSTLMARLTALMGEGRCGAAVAVDAWEPGAFAMKQFVPGVGSRESGVEGTRASEFPLPAPESPIPVPDSRAPAVALRRFRFPVPARVRLDHGAPVGVLTDRRGLSGGHVDRCAGPWRTSGGWWIAGGAGKAGRAGRAGEGGWDRDEWDVTLSDGATYRVFRERDTDAWFIEGVVD